MQQNDFEFLTSDKVRLRIAVMGPTKAGKSTTAIRLATLICYLRGIEKPNIIVIDTESGRSLINNGVRFEDDPLPMRFKVIGMDPPYTPDRYIAAMQHAAELEPDFVILDQASNEWQGEGGCLQMEAELESRSDYNRMRAWGVVTKKHDRFISTIESYPYDLMVNIRSKSKVVIEDESGGKAKSRQMALDAIQRDDFEFNLDIVFRGSENAEFVVWSRFPTLNDKLFIKPGMEVAKLIVAEMDRIKKAEDTIISLDDLGDVPTYSIEDIKKEIQAHIDSATKKGFSDDVPEADSPGRLRAATAIQQAVGTISDEFYSTMFGKDDFNSLSQAELVAVSNWVSEMENNLGETQLKVELSRFDNAS
jgi:hypothetical protein